MGAVLKYSWSEKIRSWSRSAWNKNCWIIYLVTRYLNDHFDVYFYYTKSFIKRGRMILKSYIYRYCLNEIVQFQMKWLLFMKYFMQDGWTRLPHWTSKTGIPWFGRLNFCTDLMHNSIVVYIHSKLFPQTLGWGM